MVNIKNSAIRISYPLIDSFIKYIPGELTFFKSYRKYNYMQINFVYYYYY